MAQMGFIKDTIKKKCISTVPEDFLHILIEGKTGCGKTSSGIKPLIYQSISDSQTALILDYKGDMKEMVLDAVMAKRGSINSLKIIGEDYGTQINILSKVDIPLAEEVLKSTMNKDKNDYWDNSSITLFSQIFQILDYSNNLLELANASSQITITKIFSLVSSATELALFMQDLKDKLKIISSLKNMSIGQFTSLNNLHKIETNIDSISKFIETGLSTETGASSGNNGIRGVLLNYLSFLRYTELNKEGAPNIVDLLNNNDVVYIDMSIYSDQTASAILTIVYRQLQMKKRSNKITIFADEYHRITPRSTYVPLDVLRSYSVRLVAAIQDKSQLENVLDKEFEQFMVNISTHINFVDTFTYTINDNNTKFNSILKKNETTFENLLSAYIYNNNYLFINSFSNKILSPISKISQNKYLCLDVVENEEVEAFLITRRDLMELKEMKIAPIFIPDPKDLNKYNKAIIEFNRLIKNGCHLEMYDKHTLLQFKMDKYYIKNDENSFSIMYDQREV